MVRVTPRPPGIARQVPRVVLAPPEEMDEVIYQKERGECEVDIS